MGEEERENEEREEETPAKGDELGEAGKRAIAAERKARQAAEKRLKEMEARVKDAEDAEKSEVERLQGQVADLTKRAEKAEANVDRFEVAAAKGLTPAQARRLVGSTREELEEDADAMRSELGLDKEEEKEEETVEEETPQDERPIGRPQEKLRAGASNEDDETPDPGKLADSILSAPF